ncbi:probable enoyl-CoA hydratase isoform X4 [Leptidea sinapis]|uniref:probable enoyl-CoA hydratase isoform X1 n=1 Tax=Leptidea sinapis TaxID=189913 RepID=UPI0021C43F86|nr:probable enoyl-CoA hydratase isoform X1 [Leptidea sinapis]XP_050671537.1 probable enoyl-CoA hydratase isoform X3 [Leptidea sinapis]XP_050671538.1 probable enoyl-CoA hydratase isoform X4 [Leptidea sinapis]
MRLLLKRFFPLININSQSQFKLMPVRKFSSKDAQKKSEVVEKTEELKKNIVVDKYGGITTLNIDRQPTRNSLDEATLREMAAAIDEFEKDPESMVLVLNGEGGSFCSGFDVDEIEAKGYSVLTDAAARLLRRPLCDKPTIAAVSGYAVAEGFELALSCDLRVIEDTAVLGCLGRRFGAPQGLFGGRKLTALIGLSRALDLLMTGRPISGKDANTFGLACKLTSTGTALGESIKLAKSLTKFPQNALIMDKLAAVNSQLNPNSEESMRDEAVMASLLGSAIDDLNKGVKKFQGGIGKHGKFYKLTEVPLKEWELEEAFEEITVTEDKKDDKKS